jgi:PAS domain-containing protein
VDRNWHITYINGRALQMVEPLNKRRGDLVGAKLWDEFEDLHGTTVALDCVRAMEQRVTVNREFYYRRLNAWLDMRVYPSPEGLTLYFQDITARKLDQQALIDNNNRLQLAIAAGRLGDWRWDAATDRVTFGARAAEILGLPADVALAWPSLRERLQPEDRKVVRRAGGAAGAGRLLAGHRPRSRMPPARTRQPARRRRALRGPGRPPRLCQRDRRRRRAGHDGHGPGHQCPARGG